MELTVGGPPPGSQSFSTHWSMLSPPAEVAEKAKFRPRPSWTMRSVPANATPRASMSGPCTSFSTSSWGMK